jgi:L-threonylcarbamoyladenylate synthase
MITIRPRDGTLSPDDAARVGDTAGGGGVLVFPTDTFYALGANPLSSRGIAKIFALKRRSPGKPLLLLLDSAEKVEVYASSVSRGHRLLMEHFWPGPLTLLFPALSSLPEGVVSAAGEIALRVPGHRLSREVVAAAGGALTGTSANRSGDPPPAGTAAALSSLAEEPDLVVEAGTLRASDVSTLLRIGEGGPTLLREGAVTLGEVEKVLADGKG